MTAMLTPWNIECDAYALRQVISHDRLKNELLLFGMEVLGQWACSEEKERFEGELRQLIRAAVDGFSPKLLVDRVSMLANEGCSNCVKAAVHRVFLETTDIVAIRDELALSGESVLESLEAFRKAWLGRRADDKPSVKTAYERLQADAQRLQESVSKLPRGVVIP